MSVKEVSLLNHQFEILSDTTTKIMGLVGGYGNGKTYTACRKSIQLATLNIGYTGIVTEPTFPMLRDIFIPEMKQALEEWGIRYKFNASSFIFTLYIGDKESKILCMSLENYERIVGINAAWIICDEFDTSKMEIAIKGFQKLLGRLRVGNVRQFVIFTTPEGFKATYKIFIEDNDGSRKIIKAKTSDNKYLPSDFIDTLKEQYPEALLKAYLEGEFVNLTSGTIYSYFNRDKHHSDEVENEYEQLIIGQDFNVGGCISIVYIKRGNTYIAVNEYSSYDTRAVIQTIKQNYPNRSLAFYPDASGNNRKTTSDSDIAMIRQEGFMVYVNSTNPAVKDRINATNNAFEKGLLKVNTKRCPQLTKAFEQHSYTEKGEPEKFNTAGSVDDYTDSGTYPIAYLMPVVKPYSRARMTGY